MGLCIGWRYADRLFCGRSGEFHPDGAILNSGGMGADRTFRGDAAMAGSDIKGPSVERAEDLVALQDAGTQRAAPVGTGVVHGVDGPLDIAQGVAFATDFDGPALAGAQAVEIRDIDESLERIGGGGRVGGVTHWIGHVCLKLKWL